MERGKGGQMRDKWKKEETEKKGRKESKMEDEKRGE